MKKSERIAAFVDQLGAQPDAALDPRYQGFFQCFNEQRYYEAHDVLEDLWLQTTGENHRYFKALIQIAGAFVHLQKQFLRPHHPKDGRRLRPAERLLKIGMNNLNSFRPRHLRFDVEALHQLCARLANGIAESDFQRNPWSPDRAPQIELMR